MDLFILISIFIALCCSLSSTPQFSTQPKYIQTGTYSLSTSQYYGNTSLTAINQTTFIIPFLSAKSPSFIAEISLQDLDFQVTPSRQINIAVQKSPSSTNDSLTIILHSHRLNYLQLLKTRYIALERSSNELLFISGKRSSFSISNTVSYNINIFAGISGVLGTNAMIWLNGFRLTAPNSNIKVDLKISAKYLLGNAIRIIISTTVIQTLAIDYAYFVIANYDESQIQMWPFPAFRITLVSLSGSGSSAAVYTDSANVMKSYNTFWGLTRFNVNNQPSIRFSSSLSGSTLQGGSAHPFNNIDFLAMIFQFKECASTTPYYMVATDICYDICPSRFYENEGTPSSCQPCTQYSCFKCTINGLCSQCSALTDYRTLNPSSSLCDPLQGYFDDGLSNPTALPCNNTCKTCSISSNNCTSCNNGFLLNQKYQCHQQIIKAIQSQNLMIILIPILLVAICILVMLWIFCRRRNRDKKIHANKNNSQINQFTLSHFPQVNCDKRLQEKAVDNPTSSNSKVFTISDIKVGEQIQGDMRSSNKSSFKGTILNFI